MEVAVAHGRHRHAYLYLAFARRVYRHAVLHHKRLADLIADGSFH
jgi:hypothetical protein